MLIPGGEFYGPNRGIYKTFVLGDDSHLPLGTQSLGDKRGNPTPFNSLGRSRTTDNQTRLGLIRHQSGKEKENL